MATTNFNGNNNQMGVEENKKVVLNEVNEQSDDKKKKVEGIAATGAGLGLVAGAGNIMSALDEDLQLDDAELDAIVQNALDEVLNENSDIETAVLQPAEEDDTLQDEQVDEGQDHANNQEQEENVIEDVSDTVQEENQETNDDVQPEDEQQEDIEMMDINIDEIPIVTDLNTDYDKSIAQQLTPDNDDLQLFDTIEQDTLNDSDTTLDETVDNIEELDILEGGQEGDALETNDENLIQDSPQAPHFDMADLDVNEEEILTETTMPDFDFDEIDTSEKMARSELRVDGMTTVMDDNGNEIVAARMLDSNGTPYLLADIDGDGFFNEMIDSNGHVIDPDWNYNLTAGDLKALSDTSGGYMNLDGISEHAADLDAMSQFVNTDGSLIAEDLTGDDISDEDLFAQIYDQEDGDSLANVYDNEDFDLLDNDELANIDIDDTLDTMTLDEDEA